VPTIWCKEFLNRYRPHLVTVAALLRRAACHFMVQRGHRLWRQTNSSKRSFESGMTAPTRATLTVLQQAFERAGVEFTNDDEPGVKLRRKGKRK
jgi:hypothetical protein